VDANSNSKIDTYTYREFVYRCICIHLYLRSVDVNSNQQIDTHTPSRLLFTSTDLKYSKIDTHTYREFVYTCTWDPWMQIAINRHSHPLSLPRAYMCECLFCYCYLHPRISIFCIAICISIDVHAQTASLCMRRLRHCFPLLSVFLCMYTHRCLCCVYIRWSGD